MKPFETLAEATSPDGERLVLQRRDREHVIRVGGQVLMTSRAHASERALAAVATDDLRARNVRAPHVVLGGLGLGFTLRALLDALPEGAKVTVAEISAAIVTWNRTFLHELSGGALDDPRVALETRDVGAVVRASRGDPAARPSRAVDAILLDVDNGPSALTRRANRALYGPAALRAAFDALAPQGLYVVWSAAPDPAFASRMQRAGFAVTTRTAKSGDARHVLFVGRRP